MSAKQSPTQRRLTILALVAVLLLALGIGARMTIRAMSPMPTKLGVFYGRLQPCPEYPNCVSSQATDELHKVAPISFAGMERRAAYEILKDIVAELPGATVLVSRVDYVHVEYSSRIWGFRDDTEFWLNDSTSTIEIRSAARLGKGDLGVNRRRVEEVRARFTQAVASSIKG